MGKSVKIVRFKSEPDTTGKVHIGIQGENGKIVHTLCRGEVLGIVGEVVFGSSGGKDCSLCLMKKRSLEEEFGTLKKWAEKKGYSVGADFSD
ncbi:MAG: hypothetical protein JW727_00460 [Candidatus Aenigmarchaeota archaeon]|nr:hypothetical protein [Candidatus Aenigmarchaeota archaeon]